MQAKALAKATCLFCCRYYASLLVGNVVSQSLINTAYLSDVMPAHFRAAAYGINIGCISFGIFAGSLIMRLVPSNLAVM